MFQEEYDILLRANKGIPIKRKQFGQLHLLEGPCPFRTDNGCLQYTLRPMSCRAYPCDIAGIEGHPDTTILRLNGSCAMLMDYAKDCRGIAQLWGSALDVLGLTQDEFWEGIILRGYVLERSSLIIESLSPKQRRRHDKWESEIRMKNGSKCLHIAFPIPAPVSPEIYCKMMYALYLDGGKSEKKAVLLLKQWAFGAGSFGRLSQ